MVKLSRHARNNIKLYKISETDIIETMSSPNLRGKEGDRLIAVKKFAGKYSGYPLKVVYREREEETIIVTAYPLKRKDWR